LGQSGGTASNFINFINEAHFIEGLGYLAPDLVTIMFATNEQNGGVAPDTLRANVEVLGNRIRAARPLCDLLIICPCANGLTGKPYTMVQYRDALYEAAVNLNAGFLDLTKVFGEYDSYKYVVDGSTRNLFNSDNIHPNTDGAYVLSQAVYKFLNSL
jgi:lysophospholipase L1-like esterase